MKVLIHACPARMWYVEGFLIPSLTAQGLGDDEVEVWCDTEGKGNLRSCMESFAARKGHGGTWHIQDDVLISRDFVRRCQELDEGVVYGFCCEQFRDDVDLAGRVYPFESWHSFQCVRIPDEYARDCARWFFEDARQRPEYYEWVKTGKMDDSFFHEYLELERAAERVLNCKPCLVEHVDLLIGGSIVNEWRGFWARAHWWDDEELVEELKEKLRARSR